MPCPTCDHTLAQTLTTASESLYQCPRCGTVVIRGGINYGSVSAVYVPKLVERCREFGRHLVIRARLENCDLWDTLGIAESIRKPE